MFWKKKDGIAVAEMITLFTLVSIITFSTLPFYNNLITRTHQTKVLTMYHDIINSVITSTVDSVEVNGRFNVPFPNQLANNKIINLSDSNKWADDGAGTWTYLPTGAKIIYTRIKQNDFSLIIRYNE